MHAVISALGFANSCKAIMVVYRIGNMARPDLPLPLNSWFGCAKDHLQHELDVALVAGNLVHLEMCL